MLCFATLLSMGWDNFFSGMEHTTTNGETNLAANNVRIDSTTGNFEVFKCSFANLHPPTDDISGGAISITGPYAMLVDNCLFSTCTSNKHGGAIYFDGSTGGECAISSVCAGECNAINQGQFCYINTKIDGVNTVIYSSFIKSSNDNFPDQNQFVGGETLRLEKGNTQMSYTNVSNNKCHWYPALVYKPGTPQNVIRFCSIASNEATKASCISCLAIEVKKLVDRCNVILNRVPDTGTTKGNVFSVDGDLTVKSSCLLSNVAKEFFKNNGNVDKRIQLFDCTFDEMNINKASFVKKETLPFILGINMLKTAFCSASYDSLPEGGGPKIEVIPADKNVKKTFGIRKNLLYNIIRFVYI